MIKNNNNNNIVKIIRLSIQLYNICNWNSNTITITRTYRLISMNHILYPHIVTIELLPYLLNNNVYNF